MPKSTPSEPLRLGYVLFYVADVRRTAEFWSSAFGCTIKFVHESGDYAELATGDTALGFVADTLLHAQHLRYRPNRADLEPAGAEVGWVTRSPHEAFARATQAGAKVVKPLETKPWGQISGFVSDLNGILVEICTPVEHA
jgi:lactoylglutathione lyase